MKNPTIDSRGNKFWFDELGNYHRENDLPAVEYTDGTKFWYQNGLRHRKDGLPALEYYWGDKYWYQNGLCCRNDTWIAWNK